ncbi:MAG: hypothetical protein E7Z85_07360 [Methanosphaera stadtmanae]|nr:hypothetical protein [Methanosphaera stadtmanae]
MAERLTVYLDENITNKMKRYANKSKLVKEALNMYFINKDYFLSEKKVAENNIKEYNFKLEKEKIKLERIEKQIEEIDKKNSKGLD